MKRFALATVFVSMLAIAVGYGTAFLPGGAPKGTAFVFAIATAAMMVAVLVLGASRTDGVRVKALYWVFGFCFLVLAVGFSLALAAPPVAPDARLWLGLPRGAAIILYVVGLMPLLVLPIAYALTFERITLSEDELATIRRKLAELKHEAETEREAALR